ncbi:MAG: pyrrolo-quinoline quinone, partial [Planctomycetota bacterium]|nr:pyrrolo-quinoline quinone [Planctomycetota bacterium]
FTVRLTAYQNRYVLINDQGEIIMVRMDPQGYIESDRVQLIKPTHEVSGRILVWSHPAFADGNIYLRNDEELRCYALKKEDPM